MILFFAIFKAFSFSVPLKNDMFFYQTYPQENTNKLFKLYYTQVTKKIHRKPIQKLEKKNNVIRNI